MLYHIREEVQLVKINTLEYFITLAESKSINEAAKKLYISQPCLTKALQQLEKEIGVKLFLRANSGIHLTWAGEKILPEAKQMVEYYYGWKEIGSAPILEQINVYSHSSFPDFLLPDLVLRFRKKYSEQVFYYMTSADLDSCISQNIHQPSISMFVCAEKDYRRLSKLQGNEPSVLMDGEFRCLVNARCPLAKKGYVTQEEMQQYYLAFPARGNLKSAGTVPGILKCIKSMDPSRFIYLESATTVVSFVRKNPEAYALAYYPALKRYPGEDLVNVPIKDIDVEGKMCLFYSRHAYEQYPIIQELVTAIEDAAARFLTAINRSESTK